MSRAPKRPPARSARTDVQGGAEAGASLLLEVAAEARDYRLPELDCGFDHGNASAPVGYPVACSPQAWAPAAPFTLLQAMLGVSARKMTLEIHEPRLPDWLNRVELRDLRVADASVGSLFTERARARASR